MKILITGGAGFLGAWVARTLLASGFDVRSLDFSEDATVARAILGASVDRVEWRRGDVSEKDDVDAAMADCSGVIHIAGILTPGCRADPVHGAKVNLIGTLNVFEAAKRHRLAKVLYTSSAAVFGPTDSSHPRPVTQYGAFKLAAEGSARAYWEDEGISSVGLRPLVIYGPGRTMGPSAGITLACRAAARQCPYTIPFTGRSGFVFVEEVARAFEAALSKNIEGALVYNFWGDVADVAEVIDEIRYHAPDARIAAEGPPLSVPADMDSSLLYRDFPELARIPLSLGLARTIEHYRSTAAA